MSAFTHRGRGWCVDMKQAANVWPCRVNGRVKTELLYIYAQVGAALLHHLAEDVHFHLKTAEEFVIILHPWGL